MKGHVPGGGSQLSVIVAASITLTGLAALIPGSLGQLLGFGFQQLVQGFLHAATDQFLDLPLDYFLVELYNVVGHGLSSPFRMCIATSFYQRRQAVSTFLPFSICAIYYTLSFGSVECKQIQADFFVPFPADTALQHVDGDFGCGADHRFF